MDVISRWNTLLLCTAMAIGLCFVSGRITFEHRQDVIQQQAALLQGTAWTYDGKPEYLPMFQNRLLFPALMTGLDALTPLSLSQSYLVVRLLTVFASLWVIVWVAQRISGGLPSREQFLFMMLLFFGFIFTFNFPPGEAPSDLPDGMFTALFVWASISYRLGFLLGLSLVAAFNRESAAFAGVIWALLNFDFATSRLSQMKTLLEGAAVSVVTYAWVLAIRHAVSDYDIPLSQQQFLMAGPDFWAKLSDFLSRPDPSDWPVLITAALIPWWLVLRAGSPTSVEKRLLVTAGVLALSTLLFGAVNELRVFIPSFVLVALAGAHRLSNSSTSPKSS